MRIKIKRFVSIVPVRRLMLVVAAIWRRSCRLGPACLLSIVILGSFLMLPENALALQSHRYPEGLYVHQMAHVFFLLALGYLYWDIRRTRFTGKGWRYLEIFCIIMMCWNMVAFTGHAIDVYAENILTITDDYLWSKIQGPINFHKLLFYLAKFDHMLAVPGLLFLFIGMRSLYFSVEKHAGEAGK